MSESRLGRIASTETQLNKKPDECTGPWFIGCFEKFPVRDHLRKILVTLGAIFVAIVLWVALQNQALLVEWWEEHGSARESTLRVLVEGTSTGRLIIDGDMPVMIHEGQNVIELTPGEHTIECAGTDRYRTDTPGRTTLVVDNKSMVEHRCVYSFITDKE